MARIVAPWHGRFTQYARRAQTLAQNRCSIYTQLRLLTVRASTPLRLDIPKVKPSFHTTRVVGVGVQCFEKTASPLLYAWRCRRRKFMVRRGWYRPCERVLCNVEDELACWSTVYFVTPTLRRLHYTALTKPLKKKTCTRSLLTR